MKKILALLAVLLVAFMVFACGGNETPAPTTGTSASTTATTAANADGSTTGTQGTTGTTGTTATAPTTGTTTPTTAPTTAPTTGTTATTGTTGTTAPVVIKPGDVIFDLEIDFEENKFTDKAGLVSMKKHNAVVVDSIEVTHNGITVEKPVLAIRETNSWVECTFTNLADAAAFNALVTEMKGFTVEAFYVNATKTNVQGIICVTEGNAKAGKQGWGIADNAGKPYFITGTGSAYASTGGWAGDQTTATDVYHVVGVYDVTAQKILLYINGAFIKEAAADGFTAVTTLGKDSTGELVFNCGNGFFLGGDPTVQSAACDYPASALSIVDAKIYAGALTAAKVAELYATATADFKAPEEPEQEDGKFVVLVPAGNTTTAINVATGKVFADTVNTITAAPAEGETPVAVELKGGYFYLAEKEGDTVKIVKELGAAVETKSVCAGHTNAKDEATILKNTYTLKHNSYFIRAQALKSFKLNNHIGFAALNTALGEDAETVGYFGTIKFLSLDPTQGFYVEFDKGDGATEKQQDFITDAEFYNVNFVYVGYEGETLAAATGKNWAPVVFDQMELVRYATDMAYGNAYGTLDNLWIECLKTYGGYTSIVTQDNTFNGTSIQNANTGAWQNYIAPIYGYTSAVTNYNTATAKKDVATIKAEFDAAVAALAAAQKAFDDAVAANETVAALKADLDAKLAALNEAKQAEYVAKAAYETSKSKKGANHEETVALKPAYDAATAAKAAPQEAYDKALAAYNEAVAANETLKALAADLVVDSAASKNIYNNEPEKNVDEEGKAIAITTATAHNAAKVFQDRVDTYNKYTAIYTKFMAEYNKAANVALWTPGGDLAESVLYKAFKDIPAEIVKEDGTKVANWSLPTYTYYYDAVADTYTIFVTSGRQATTVYDNLNSNSGNKAISGRNWIVAPTQPVYETPAQ